MKAINMTLSMAALALLVACNSQPARGGEKPALIAGATLESRAELQRLVSEALHGAPVTLAEDAFTRESTLIIERNPPQNLQQRPLQGRDMDRPKKFRLLLSGERCWLERESDGERWELLQAKCVPAGG
ncbi:hypothetical protein [Microbulbifer rhizosphaerae]|uniref:Lipoprotein n=1 Tax=Microbulbifer rhizosphaerae TaxID=1562603 RepID=A0A7W4W8F8_9GAMM|nr:hypothetical protein [Microbulbifer rhizosphaerae]MBB3059642.1 hypothetical protein [Microbulbifer rhizosphaerae]